MSDKDFVVKNGLVVNTAFTANSTQFGIGSNVVVTPAGITVGTGGVNSVVNSTAVTVGNTSQNTSITANGVYINGSYFGGGYGTGNTSTGDTAFFVGGQTVNSNFTTNATSNYLSIGTVTIQSGVTVTVTTGSRWAIV